MKAMASIINVKINNRGVAGINEAKKIMAKMKQWRGGMKRPAKMAKQASEMAK